jgi:hypothetical protein
MLPVLTADDLLHELRSLPFLSSVSLAVQFEFQYRGVWVSGRLFDRGTRGGPARFKAGLILSDRGTAARFAKGRGLFGTWQSSIPAAVEDAIGRLQELPT